MEFLQSISVEHWFFIVFVAVLVGLSKTALSGLLMLATAVMANVFGGKATTGIILPMLIVGDVFAVYYYKSNADWKSIKKLLPWTLVGFFVAAIIGNMVNDKQFKFVIGICVAVCLLLLIYIEKRGENFQVPRKLWFYGLTGTAAGFATMIGNVAGPIFSVYLLSMGYKKKDFMGTSAVFFMIVNLLKVPLQVFFWRNIGLGQAALAVLVIPAVAVGAFIGVNILKKINEKVFRYLIIFMTAIATARLLIP
jgi:uncharacterized membrane protein YfcA